MLVVYYSMYGNTYRMARAVAEGAGSAGSCEAVIKRVPELISRESIEKNEAARAAAREQEDVPAADPKELADYDGIVFGSPTRFGNQAARMKNFIDQTGSLWVKGALAGKPAGFFTGSSTLHGGQETTIITMMIPLLHHGMIMVGLPPTTPELSAADLGGSYYGASFVTGPKRDKHPTESDLNIARALGRRVAEIAAKLRAA